MTILRIENLGKSFQPLNGPRVDVLKSVHLTLSKGECIAITGRSGSGKSTLLSLMAGLERADQGKVEILNQNWDSMTDEVRSQFRGKHIGFVFQSFYLLPHLTAYENVHLPLEIANLANDAKASADRAAEWLNHVGLWERRHHLPRELSGGEQQRVAIARALIHQPDLVFLDEPTGNLDESTGAALFKLLFSLRDKTSLVLVTHDMEQAKMADRHFSLQRGEVAEVRR